MSEHPTQVFISYSWDDDQHKEWVRSLANRLQKDGINVVLDQLNLVPGDDLTMFMERAVRECDFVLYICTPHYKAKSDNRDGGVGYEEHVMTGELLVQRNQRKFIPILRTGQWKDAAPAWSAGKYYIDLSGTPYSEQNYRILLSTLHSKVDDISSTGGTHNEIPVGIEDTEFVNRKIELATLEAMHEAYWQCALITAPTGYGKSRLLKRLIYNIQQNEQLRHRWNFRYVDLSNKNPEDALDFLWEQICERKLTSAYTREDAATYLREYVLNTMSRTVPNGPPQGVLLIIDGVENIPMSSAEWLFKVLHDIITGSYIDYGKGQASFPVRLILSGVSAETFWSEYRNWENTSGSKRRLRSQHVLELSALNKEHVEELIARRAGNQGLHIDQSIICEIADKLLYLSGGHPAVINDILDELFAINLREYDDYLGVNRQRLISKYVSRVSQRILDHFPVSQAQRDIKTICVFRLINLKTLSALLANGLITPQADINLLAALCEHKILKIPSPDKSFYHDDIVRRILYLDLSYRNIDDAQHVQNTHQCAKDLYCKLIEGGTEQSTMHYYFVEWLFHALQIKSIDINTVLYEWKSMLSKIESESVPVAAQIDMIKKMINSDSEIRYLYHERFDTDDFSSLFQ